MLQTIAIRVKLTRMYDALAIVLNRLLGIYPRRVIKLDLYSVNDDMNFVAEEWVLVGIKLEPGKLEGTWWFLSVRFLLLGGFCRVRRVRFLRIGT